MHPAIIAAIVIGVVVALVLVARRGRPAGVQAEGGAELLPGDVDAVLAEADGLLEEGETRAARRALKSALETAPDQIDLWIALADAYLSDGDPDEAIEALDRAVELQAWDAELRLKRAETQVLAGSPARAIDDYDFLINQQPELLEPWLGKARALLRLSRPESALAFLEEAERKLENDPALLAPLAEAYFATEDYEAALECWLAHLEQEEYDADALRAVAETYQALGRTEEAAEYLRRADEAVPEDLASSEDAAHALLLAGRFEEAAEAYETVLAAGRGDLILVLRLGEALLGAGRPQKGYEAYARLVQLEPATTADLAARAEGLFRLGLSELGLKAAGALAAKDPKHTLPAALLQIECHLALGDIRSALEQWAVVGPGQVAASPVSGRMYLLGQRLGANICELDPPWLPTAMEERPADRHYYLGRALGLVGSGNIEGAVTVLDELLQKRLADEIAFRERSELHRILGNDEQADSDFAQANGLRELRDEYVGMVAESLQQRAQD